MGNVESMEILFEDIVLLNSNESVMEVEDYELEFKIIE